MKGHLVASAYKRIRWRLEAGSAWMCMGMLRCITGWQSLSMFILGRSGVLVDLTKCCTDHNTSPPYPILPRSGRLSGMSLIAFCMSAWSTIYMIVRQGSLRVSECFFPLCSSTVDIATPLIRLTHDLGLGLPMVIVHRLAL